MSNASFDDDLKFFFSADPDTGVLKKFGLPVGIDSADGYTRVNHQGRYIKAHRLIWFLVHGRWPMQLDHINGIKNDNRLSNLKEGTQTQNMLNPNNRLRSNNSSGTRGVRAQRDRWRAYITINKKFIHLGIFHSKDEAIAARKQAELNCKDLFE